MSRGWLDGGRGRYHQAAGVALALAAVVATVGLRSPALLRQGVAGLVLTAAAAWGAAAFVDRSRREPGHRQAAAYVGLGAVAVLLPGGQGGTYLALAVAGTPASVTAERLPLIVALPVFYVAWRCFPAIHLTRFERTVVTLDTLIAFLCALAIIAQLDAPGAERARLSWVDSVLPVAQAFGVAIVVWVAGRNRFQGPVPARQLALWLAGCSLYLIVSVVSSLAPNASDNPTDSLRPYVTVVCVALAVLAARGRVDEGEGVKVMRWRTASARVAPLILPTVLLIVLAIDVYMDVPVSHAARTATAVAIAVGVLLVGVLRRMAEADSEGLRAAVRRRSLDEGTREAWFEAVVADTADVVALTDEYARIAYCTPNTARIWGPHVEPLVGRDFRSLLRPSDLTIFAGLIASSVSAPGQEHRAEVQVVRADGGIRDVELVVRSIEGREQLEAGFAITVRDHSERRQLNRFLAIAESTDAVTSDANLPALLTHARSVLATAAPRDVALLVLDLDRFSGINDTIGISKGDELLVEVSRSIRASVRPWDLVARIGADEFAVLVVGTRAGESARRIHGRVLRRLAALQIADGTEFSLSASAGFAVNDEAGEVAEELMRHAELALALAGTTLRGDLVAFETTMHQQAISRAATCRDLREAFRDGDLELHYQPVVDLSSRCIVGAEGLLRWRHKSRGLLAAHEFFPLIQELGLSRQLNDWVLSTACDDLARICREFPDIDRFSLGVNIAADELLPSLVREVSARLTSAGADPRRFVVEVTESAIADARAALPVINGLRALGVAVAIDDFGVGYSSLGFLSTFPVDYLKVDRSFVSGLDSDPSRAALAHAVLIMAAALSLPAIVEGIETEAELAVLTEGGCALGQGWLFAAAMPVDELTSALSLQGAG